MIPSSAKEIIEQHQKQVPVPLKKIADSLGISVMAKGLDNDIAGSIERLENDKYEILINAWQEKTRQRFTVAHQIAHFLLHRDEIDGGLKFTRKRKKQEFIKEIEANTLAAEILMPVKLLNSTIKKNRYHTGRTSHIEDLARMFSVSVPAMKRRLQELGYIKE